MAEDQAHHEDPGQVQHQTGHIRTRRHGACDQEEESSREIGRQGAPGQSGGNFYVPVQSVFLAQLLSKKAAALAFLNLNVIFLVEFSFL